MPRGLDDAKQQAFIDEYENLLNTMGADEAVAFVDAVHPTHQVRPAGCWARKDVAVAVEQTTGRERLNIHGAINLETAQTQILAVEKVNALSFIKLSGEIKRGLRGSTRPVRLSLAARQKRSPFVCIPQISAMLGRRLLWGD